MGGLGWTVPVILRMQKHTEEEEISFLSQITFFVSRIGFNFFFFEIAIIASVASVKLLREETTRLHGKRYAKPRAAVDYQVKNVGRAQTSRAAGYSLRQS